MADPDARMFRAEALEQLSSPEQLDQLLAVTSRRSWLPLAVTGAALLGILLWSLLGRIPVTVDGRAILVYPRQVVSFQAPASGQIVSIDVQVGDLVERGQTIGAINQPELAQRLEQERVRLSEALRRYGQVDVLRVERARLERENLERKQRLLDTRIASLQRTAEEQKRRNDEYIAQQRKNLARLRQTSRELGEAHAERFASYRSLLQEGLSSEDAVLNARQRMIDSQMQVANMELRAQEIELSQFRAESAYLEQLDEIAELQAQSQEIEVRRKQLEQQQMEADSDRELEIQEMRRNIDRLEQDLRGKGRIVSEYAGRVLEMNTSPGTIVVAGERLGAIEAENTAARLMAAAYLDVASGKRIRPGMEVRVTPDTVERERFGGMQGTVSSVSPFAVSSDAAVNVVGNREVAMALTRGGGKIQVLTELLLDPESHTGYRWTSGSGPRTPISAGTTARIRATVEHRRPITFVIPVLRRWSGV